MSWHLLNLYPRKYLQPLEMTEQEKRSQKRGLEEYRDVIIFTFLFTNALYIVGVTMLQVLQLHKNITSQTRFFRQNLRSS